MAFMSVVKGIGKWVFRHRSEILLVGGIVSGGACVVTACVNTLKLGDIVDEAKEDIDDIHDLRDDPECKLTEKEASKQLTKVYLRTAGEIVKIYIIPAALGAMSVGMLIGSHSILRKDNIALAAACTAISESFNKYRKRVVDEYGEDKDYEYFNGLKKVGETESVDDNGNVTKVPIYETFDVPDQNPYTILFDETNPRWNSYDPHMNVSFVKQSWQVFEHILMTRGYITYNEIREYYALPPVPYGFTHGVMDVKKCSHLDMDVLHKENWSKCIEELNNGMGIWITFKIDPVPLGSTLGNQKLIHD